MLIPQGQELRAYLLSVARADTRVRRRPLFQGTIGFGPSEILFGTRTLTTARIVEQHRRGAGRRRQLQTLFFIFFFLF